MGATEDADVVADAKAALTQMGWKPAIAHAAVEAAAAVMGAGTPLEPLLVEALKRCAQSRGTTRVARDVS